jgi:flagellar FliL protein
MADNEQAEGGAAEAAEVPAPKRKLKLMIAAAAVLVMVAVVAASWFLFFRHPGEEMHAEAAPAKPPVFLEVPDMLVNLSGPPGERVQ